MWPPVEERIASALAAALLQERTDRRERRRLRHAAQCGRTMPARSRSPRPQAEEEVLFPEEWLSPSEGPSAASPSPASTRSKYGGVPAPPSTSSGRSRSAPGEELRAVECASHGSASVAARQEEVQAPRSGECSLRPGGRAGSSGAPAAPPPPPPARKGSARPVPEDERAIRRASRTAASDAAWMENELEAHHGDRSVRPGGGAGPSGAPAAPPPPPPTRTRKFPRGRKFHAGPRLLALPAERRWEGGGAAPGSPPPGTYAGNLPGWIVPARTWTAPMIAFMGAQSVGEVIRLLTASWQRMTSPRLTPLRAPRSGPCGGADR